MQVTLNDVARYPFLPECKSLAGEFGVKVVGCSATTEGKIWLDAEDEGWCWFNAFWTLSHLCRSCIGSVWMLRKLIRYLQWFRDIIKI